MNTSLPKVLLPMMQRWEHGEPILLCDEEEKLLFLEGYLHKDYTEYAKLPKTQETLEKRLQVFTRGADPVIPIVPSWDQIRLGSAEMASAVFFPDKTDTERYKEAVLGRKKLGRTIALIKELGWDHLRVGSGLGSPRYHVAFHINYVYHDGGNPVYDMQLQQTHENGLDYLWTVTHLMQHSTDSGWRRRRAFANSIVPRASEYREKLLDLNKGWTVKADQLVYDGEMYAEEHKEAYKSLVDFMNHCAKTFPREPTGFDAVFLYVTLSRLALRGFFTRMQEIYRR
jgi:hypothetical protein